MIYYISHAPGFLNFMAIKYINPAQNVKEKYSNE